MKKNSVVRVLSLLLVLTLISTCAISATFAKYITSDSAQDTARVAKFGVVATVNGNLFGDSYATAPGNSIQAAGNNHAITVTAVNTAAAGMGDKLVAPGTKNENGMTFAVKGTPEVSTSVVFDRANLADGSDKKPLIKADVVLMAGTYGVMIPFNGTLTSENAPLYWVADGENFKKSTGSTADLALPHYELVDVVENANDYYPIAWTYQLDTATAVTDRGATALSAADTALNSHFDTTDNNTPNTKLDKVATLKWEWAFENSENSHYVANQDTILGDLIAKAAQSLDSVASTAEANAETPNFVVVKKTSESAALTVKYAQVTAGSAAQVTSGDANYVVIAFTGDQPATAQPGAFQSSNVAVLTVAYDASLTVTQID